MSTALADEEYIGQSGHSYRIVRELQEETFPPRLVCLATAGDRKFILKYIHTVNFKDLQEINDRLHGSTNHIRLAQDTIPKKSVFVFKYFADHLPYSEGLAPQNIKVDNVFIDWKGDQDGIVIERVQLEDLEDAAHIPPGSHMIGKQAGNWMWRSPEAHTKEPVNKPSDIFSFALCIYAMHKRVIFAIGEEELDEGVDPLAIVIERQISYFADEDGLNGFLKYLGDNPWVRVFEVTRDGFNKDNPRRPFFLWKGVDDDFKSLIRAMTNFDPEKRITAHEALAHKWFEGVL
ncbi:serine/threonine protein kinase [Blastomyces parvus]|uniref:Serine/threonine protein kinase n=1 Tax=Blastomyces parvus TaxID=2060905 RepID=A0A2B7XA86_9EURO|nr:serine/threonine protein kinase [Blastomyces parvus]